jgi:formylmethanofuran dehydrogenase subunit C
VVRSKTAEGFVQIYGVAEPLSPAKAREDIAAHSPQQVAPDLKSFIEQQLAKKR